MHPNKAARKRIVAILRDADIRVAVGGALTAATVVEHPPNGGWIAETSLPGIYCFARSERITPDTMSADERRLLIDIVLQGKGQRDDVIDQVDDMQLAVEMALMADDTAGGLFDGFRPVGSEVYTNQGEVVFAARRLSFEAQLNVLRTDPTIT